MLPKLEKLLLDADLNIEIQPYLRAVGFRTRFALHVKADVRDDTALLRWSRRYGYILVCHDKYSDRATRLRIYPELYQNGGKVLRIAGDSSQDTLTVVGKILVDHEAWHKWFEENDGIVILRANNQLINNLPMNSSRGYRVTWKALILPNACTIGNPHGVAVHVTHAMCLMNNSISLSRLRKRSDCQRFMSASESPCPARHPRPPLRRPQSEHLRLSSALCLLEEASAPRKWSCRSPSQG